MGIEGGRVRKLHSSIGRYNVPSIYPNWDLRRKVSVHHIVDPLILNRVLYQGLTSSLPGKLHDKILQHSHACH
jgi:hypothetical protein